MNSLIVRSYNYRLIRYTHRLRPLKGIAQLGTARYREADRKAIILVCHTRTLQFRLVNWYLVLLTGRQPALVFIMVLVSWVVVIVLAGVTSAHAKRRIPCHLEKFIVKETDVNWKRVGRHLGQHEVVIHPPQLQIWTCMGSCPYRTKDILSFTEHARILSALGWATRKQSSSKTIGTPRGPLCAPAKLESVVLKVFNNKTSDFRRVRLEKASAVACQCS